MIVTKKFNTVKEVQKLQELACKMDVDVGIHSLDGSIIIDAKTFIGLFSINFDEPVNIVCEDENFIKKLNKLIKN